MSSHSDFAQAAHALGCRAMECALADFTSLARGKLMVVDEWVAQRGCRMPNVLFGMTVTGGSPKGLFGSLMPTGYGDMQCEADLDTLRARPGRPHEATVMCDPAGRWLAESLGREVDASELSPRFWLKKVLARYADVGLQATVAPELKLFLLHRHGTSIEAAHAHPDSPGFERACEQYTLERTAHFEPFFDELYAG